MPPTLLSPANSFPFQFAWRNPQQPVSKNLALIHSHSFAPLTACSLRTSINYEPEEGLGQIPVLGPTKLPVVIRQSGGRVSRYMWDEEELVLMNVDGGAASFSVDLEDGLRNLLRISSVAVRNFFIPKQVPHNYIGYVKWKLLHRVFSSALQLLATQAMFRAFGIGYSRSFPSAAALNWVLKDGLGRLSRCVYTASLASVFDTNLKRVRFSTSVLFSLSIGVELLTPTFPQHFLLLATLANIAKQMSLASYLATSSAIHRSFAVSDNLGEVSAKAQIQSVCFDILGLMLAAVLNFSFKNDQRLLAGLPFVAYPIFSALDLFGIYQGLKHVHLQTLTKDRLEIILNSWIEFRQVLSPAEVNKVEGIDFLWSKSKELWPIRIGCLNLKVKTPKFSVLAMQSLEDKDYYFICLENGYKGLRRNTKKGILLCLREGAGTADVMMGLLQACHIRKGLLLCSSWETILEASNASDFPEWLTFIEDSKRCAEKDFLHLEDQMAELGWAVKNILLSTQEQSRYSFIED